MIFQCFRPVTVARRRTAKAGPAFFVGQDKERGKVSSGWIETIAFAAMGANGGTDLLPARSVKAAVGQQSVGQLRAGEIVVGVGGAAAEIVEQRREIDRLLVERMLVFQHENPENARHIKGMRKPMTAKPALRLFGFDGSERSTAFMRESD